MHLFGVLCLLVLTSLTLAAEPPLALQQRDSAGIARQVQGLDDKSPDLSEQAGKDKDKPANLTAAVKPTLTPLVLPSKDLPLSTETSGADKDKDKSKDLPLSTNSPDTDKDKDKSKDLPFSTKTPDTDKDKDKGSSTILSKDQTSSGARSKDIASMTDKALPHSANYGPSPAPLTPPMIMYTVTMKPEQPSTALLSSKTELPSIGTGILSSNVSVYLPSRPTFTINVGSLTFPGYSIVPSPSESKAKSDRGSYTNLSSATIPVWTQSMLGNAYGGGFITTPSIFVTRLPSPSGPPGNVPPGYGVPSESQNGTLPTSAFGKDTPSVTMVNTMMSASGSTQAIGMTSPPYQNATGVPGNVSIPSIFVSASPQTTKSEGLGGIISSITLSLVPTLSNSEGKIPVSASALPSPSSESAVLSSLGFGGQSQSTFLAESSPPATSKSDKPMPMSTGIGGQSQSIFLAPQATIKSDKPIPMSSDIGGKSQSIFLPPQATIKSDKPIPMSTGFGGKPEISESTNLDTQSAPVFASQNMPGTSPAAVGESSLFELKGTTLPTVPTTSLGHGTFLPLLPTPSFASSPAQQLSGTFQLSSMSPNIVSSLVELSSTTQARKLPSSFASGLGTLEGGSVPNAATPSLGKVIGNSLPLVPTSSFGTSMGEAVGNTAPLAPTAGFASSLGSEIAGTTLPLVPTSSLAFSLGKELPGITPSLVPTPSLASSLASEIVGTALPLQSTPSPASSFGKELSGTALSSVPTTSLASSLGSEIAGTDLSLAPTPSPGSSLANEFSGTTLPLPPTLGVTSSLGTQFGGTTLPPVPTSSSASSHAIELGGTTLPHIPTRSFASSLGEVFDKTVPTLSTSTSKVADVKPESPTSVTTVTGENAASKSTATPIGESGRGSETSLSFSSAEIPKQITGGVLPPVTDTPPSQQSAFTSPDSSLNNGDTKFGTSLPIGSKGAPGTLHTSPSNPILSVEGSISGVIPIPAAKSSNNLGTSALGISNHVYGTPGSKANSSISLNVNPTSIQYFEGSAAHVTWSFGGVLLTFLASVFWL